MILIIGGTGTAGSAVVREALARGGRVRALARDPERARGILGGEVELAAGDLADQRSVRAALEGAEALFLSCADDPRRVDWETAAIAAASAAGVRRIVRLSTVGAAPGAPVAFWDWHGRVDARLGAAGVPAVVLHASFFMSNLLAGAGPVAREGVLPAPAGGARIAMVDPADVGAAAGAALTGAGEDGASYTLTGPRAVTYEEVAEALAAAADRPVAFAHVPDEAARQGMVAGGVPDAVAEQVVRVFAMLRRGVAEEVSGDVERLAGRPPRDIRDWARDNADAFRAEGAAPGG